MANKQDSFDLTITKKDGIDVVTALGLLIKDLESLVKNCISAGQIDAGDNVRKDITRLKDLRDQIRLEVE